MTELASHKYPGLDRLHVVGSEVDLTESITLSVEAPWYLVLPRGFAQFSLDHGTVTVSDGLDDTVQEGRQFILIPPNGLFNTVVGGRITFSQGQTIEPSSVTEWTGIAFGSQISYRQSEVSSGKLVIFSYPLVPISRTGLFKPRPPVDCSNHDLQWHVH